MAPLSLPHRHTLAAFLCAPLLAAAVATRYIGAAPTLIDHSIASGAAPMYLDGSEWTVTGSQTRTTTRRGVMLPSLRRGTREHGGKAQRDTRDASSTHRMKICLQSRLATGRSLGYVLICELVRGVVPET